jgi:CubicO group peptidase (beta-lactamase class C family)
MYQPGTTFEYGLSTDVLGCIVEAVSGVSLDRYVAERIAGPLKLSSFSFQVTEAEKKSRLAHPLRGPGDEALLRVNSDLRPQVWMSGGGGLNGNAGDYLRFAQLLLNGGELDGVRLLSPKTVTLMLSDALPPSVRYGEYSESLGSMAPMTSIGQGFGLGVTVRTVPGRNPLPGSTGDCSWAGRWGTYFWIDPLEGLACVLLMQASAERARYRGLARSLVYQAMEPATVIA